MGLFYVGILALLVSVYIIKEQNKKIRLLEEESQDLNILIDKTTLPIFVKDENGFYVECNDAFLNLVAKNKKDILNTKNKDDEPLYKLHSELDEQLKIKDQIEYIEIFIIRSKKPRVYKFYKTSIKKDGHYNGYICVMFDITDTEKKENLLQYQVYEEAERNKSIMQKREEERLSSAKFTAIGQLSAGITHEINTPLTYIKGNLEILKMDIDDIPEDVGIKKQLIESIEDMESGVLRIVTIINSMREMSHRSKVELEKKNLFSTLVTSLVMLYNRSKQTCKVFLNDEEFTLSTPKNKYEFFADIEEQRVEQAWIVIINNALDELQKKPNFNDRELRINIYKENEDVLIRFADNGGGIPDEVMDNIFEPFISGKPESGMGIGLSIAKRILENQNAHIRAYNQNGGAVFEITIPSS